MIAFPHPRERHFAWHMMSLLAVGAILGAIPGCSGSRGFRVPPAEQPQLVSSGLQISGASGSTTTIGELDEYCNDYIASTSAYGRGFYVTVEMPALNHPEVTYRGTIGDFWGALSPAEQSLHQGPKPATQPQAQRLQGNYVAYFIHDDYLTGSDYHVVLGVLLGQGVPETGMLEIRATNTDPQNTGLQARSDPLELAITGPVRVTASVSPSVVNESQPLTMSWTASNADQVEITGGGLTSGTARPVRGSQTVTAPCTGDRDNISASYQVRALRTGCPTPRSATRSLPVTVNTPRKITQFEGVPRLPVEGSSFTLRWKTSGASSVALSGPDGFSHSAAGREGQTSAVAPPVAQCLQLQNFNYQMTATWPSCGPRTATALVSVTTATQQFTLVESGGSQCRSSHRCTVAARSLSEARSCARASCGPIQQGCTWQ